jgi:hypothetical protein
MWYICVYNSLPHAIVGFGWSIRNVKQAVTGFRLVRVSLIDKLIIESGSRQREDLFRDPDGAHMATMNVF